MSGFGRGVAQGNNDGDGIALYDKAANRWVISQFFGHDHTLPSVRGRFHHLPMPPAPTTAIVSHTRNF